MDGTCVWGAAADSDYSVPLEGEQIFTVSYPYRAGQLVEMDYLLRQSDVQVRRNNAIVAQYTRLDVSDQVQNVRIVDYHRGAYMPLVHSVKVRSGTFSRDCVIQRLRKLGFSDEQLLHLTYSSDDGWDTYRIGLYGCDSGTTRISYRSAAFTRVIGDNKRNPKDTTGSGSTMVSEVPVLQSSSTSSQPGSQEPGKQPSPESIPGAQQSDPTFSGFDYWSSQSGSTSEVHRPENFNYYEVVGVGTGHTQYRIYTESGTIMTDRLGDYAKDSTWSQIPNDKVKSELNAWYEGRSDDSGSASQWNYSSYTSSSAPSSQPSVEWHTSTSATQALDNVIQSAPNLFFPISSGSNDGFIFP